MHSLHCQSYFTSWNWNGYEEIHGALLARIAKSASRRNLEYRLTPEFLWQLYLKQDRKCSLSGLSIKFGKGPKTTASLDRIDNTKGYIETNVQWVHKDINWMKQDYTQEEFIEYCKNVYFTNVAKEPRVDKKD